MANAYIYIYVHKSWNINRIHFFHRIQAECFSNVGHDRPAWTLALTTTLGHLGFQEVTKPKIYDQESSVFIEVIKISTNSNPNPKIYGQKSNLWSILLTSIIIFLVKLSMFQSTGSQFVCFKRPRDSRVCCNSHLATGSCSNLFRKPKQMEKTWRPDLDIFGCHYKTKDCDWALDAFTVKLIGFGLDCFC